MMSVRHSSKVKHVSSHLLQGCPWARDKGILSPLAELGLLGTCSAF